MPLAKNVDIKELAKKTENYSGADIEAICREAAMLALRADLKAKQVELKHFEKALENISPSLAKSQNCIADENICSIQSTIKFDKNQTKIGVTAIVPNLNLEKYIPKMRGKTFAKIYVNTDSNNLKIDADLKSDSLFIINYRKLYIFVVI